MKRRRKRARPRPHVELLGRRLVLGKSVALGGGLFAELRSLRNPGETAKRYRVAVSLRTRGAGDIDLYPGLWRESPAAAAYDIREVLTHLASALRLSGAN